MTWRIRNNNRSGTDHLCNPTCKQLCLITIFFPLSLGELGYGAKYLQKLLAELWQELAAAQILNTDKKAYREKCGMNLAAAHSI